ncbi:MAG: hypothetical protein JWO43_185 [Candidatus Adlerbacteria bacterium]|nr:hypothetical protein [Candidatus Adlerbacteria bacterium]
MTNNSFKDSFLRAIAVIGLIAVLILGAWGIIQIAFNLPGFLSNTGGAISSIFSRKPAVVKETTTVTLPQTTNSGEPFAIAWKHQNGTSTNYTYAVSYACAPGLSVKAPTPTGEFKAVPCATPFNYTNATANLQLTATATTTSQIAASFAVASINLATGAVTSIGTSTITVLPTRNATTTTIKPATTTAKPATTSSKPSTTVVTTNRRVSNPNGNPDLAIQILSLTPVGNGLDQVQFQISNSGDKTAVSGWNFVATLPVGYAYQYVSNPQQALYPGDRIVYTLTFSHSSTQAQYNQYNGQYQNPGCTTGTYPYTYQNCYSYTSGYNYTGTNNTAQAGYDQVVITVDPSNMVWETSEANNTASVSVPAGY